MISAYIFLSAYKREKGGMHCQAFILHALLTFSAPRYGTNACRTTRRIGSASVRRRRIAKSIYQTEPGTTPQYLDIKIVNNTKSPESITGLMMIDGP
jgi:hypothetical protein